MKVFLINILSIVLKWVFRFGLLAASLAFFAFSIKSMLFFNQKKHLIKALVRVPASQQHFQVVVMRVKNPTKLYYPDGTFLSEGTRGMSLGIKTEVITLDHGLIKLATPAKITLSISSDSRLTIGEPEILNEKVAFEQYRLDHGTIRVVVPPLDKLRITAPNLGVMSAGPSDFLITHSLKNNRYHLAVLNGRIEYRFKEEPVQYLDSGRKISFVSGQDFAGLLAFQEEINDLGGGNLEEPISKQDMVLWLNQLLPAENLQQEQKYLDTLLAHINFNQQKFAEKELVEKEHRNRLNQGLHPEEDEKSHSIQMSSEVLKNAQLKRKWLEKTELKVDPDEPEHPHPK